MPLFSRFLLNVSVYYSFPVLVTPLLHGGQITCLLTSVFRYKRRHWSSFIHTWIWFRWLVRFWTSGLMPLCKDQQTTVCGPNLTSSQICRLAEHSHTPIFFCTTMAEFQHRLTLQPMKIFTSWSFTEKVCRTLP